MIIEILFIIFMVLWFMTFFPSGLQAGLQAGYPWANGVLAWLCVMLLGLWLFLPFVRG